jgi:hypothetical protein
LSKMSVTLDCGRIGSAITAIGSSLLVAQLSTKRKSGGKNN